MSKVNIALVGEAYGEKEEEEQRPFVGPSGYLLDQMLSHAGIDRRDCFVTNVFNLRPKPSNDVKNLCGTRPEGIPGFPELQRGKYVLRRYEPELTRLYEELRNANPNIIIALGATASWALLHSSGIKGIRGSAALTPPSVSGKLGRPYKVLPTYHPAAISRDWSMRPIATLDLNKALRNSTTPDLVRPFREIWVEPTLEDLAIYERDFILPSPRIAPDIETRNDQITCIGFAPSPSSAIVIPFILENNDSYWKTKEEEIAALAYVRRWLALRSCIFQNGLYDMNVLWSRYGIPSPAAAEDTMLLHHAMQPELQKGLGFLASIYTEEASWKGMRKGMKHD